MDSVEAVQELNSLKIGLIETEIIGLKKRMDNLEIKDQEILRDLTKLEHKFADLGISVSSLTSPKVLKIA